MDCERGATHVTIGHSGNLNEPGSHPFHMNAAVYSIVEDEEPPPCEIFARLEFHHVT
jgi:hypothetical protein